MRLYSILILFALVLIACGDDSKSKASAKNPDSILHVPPYGDDVRMELFNKTIAIDVIAYKLGVSMSYNDKKSIQQMIGFISPQQGVWKKGCESVGRISFMTENGVGREAEMLIHGGCATLVWVENEKMTNMNMLTSDGHQFLNRFFPEDGNIQIPEGSKPK